MIQEEMRMQIKGPLVVPNSSMSTWMVFEEEFEIAGEEAYSSLANTLAMQ
jgi:hypothetical protein